MGVGIPEPPADPWSVRVQTDGGIQNADSYAPSAI